MNKQINVTQVVLDRTLTFVCPQKHKEVAECHMVRVRKGSNLYLAKNGCLYALCPISHEPFLVSIPKEEEEN